MSYLTTGQDILLHTLMRGGEKQDATSPYYTRATQYVMRALADITAFAPWPWALKATPGVLSIAAAVTETASSISGTTWTMQSSIAASQAGKKIILDSQGFPYRITAHTAGTAIITTDAAYTEATTTGAVTIFQDEYALASDCIKPWYAWFRNRTEIIDVARGSSAFGRFPDTTVAGSYALGVIHEAADILTVRLTPWLTTAATIDYAYTVRPSVLTWDGVVGTDTPAIPIEDRYVISDRALYYLMADKHDDRAEAALVSSQGKLIAMQTHYLDVRPAG